MRRYDDRSFMERTAQGNPAAYSDMQDKLTPYTQDVILYHWDWWARPSQRAPAGDWRTWLIMAGRGFGKTRAGAEWVRGMAERNNGLRIALVGATMAEVRAVMVEGDSGLLAIAREDLRPTYEPSLHRLSWPNETVATLFSASEPEGLRGHQHHCGWADEIGKWPNGTTTWDNLMMTMRLGDRPRTVATTTPRPVSLVRALADPARRDVTVTRGQTNANDSQLATDYLAAMDDRYRGTRLGRQELSGELIDDLPGALWTRDLIEACRVRADAVPVMRRVVVGVDPPAGAGAASDACGIVVAGIDAEKRAWVLEDASLQGVRPERWAQAVAQAAARWKADRVIAEANNGGAMVESVLRAADAALPVRLVHAAQGKVARAEPVATYYERGIVCHGGVFPELEDELCGLIAGGDYAGPGRSPDRADALVWAAWALLVESAGEPGVRML